MAQGHACLLMLLCLLTVNGHSGTNAAGSDSGIPPDGAHQRTESQSPRAFSRLLSDFEFLPYYYLRIDLSTFFLHKNTWFKERYFLENNTQFEFTLLSFRQRIYSVWGIDLGVGMGRTPEDVLFDPVDISFGIVPTIEYRARKGHVVQAGVEHRCFHEIDRQELPTVYWNKGFVAGGSPNHRLGEFRRVLNDTGSASWTFRNRFAWYARWGFFAKHFGDLVSPSKINGNNDGVQEGFTEVRYAFYRRRSWILNVREYLLLGSYDTGDGGYDLYWRQVLGVEAHFRRGQKGGMVFLNYGLDDLPKYGRSAERFSRDQLLVLGVAFYL
jgi:hypothetical protein